MNRNIYILSDSQAVIKALYNYQIPFNLVWDSRWSLTQLAEHPFIEPEPACRISMGVAKKVVNQKLDNQRPQETLGLLKQTQTGKGTHTGALCHENKGAGKLEQSPVTIGGRTIHRTLPPKTASFQTGFG
jgi:hypothetical protein